MRRVVSLVTIVLFVLVTGGATKAQGNGPSMSLDQALACVKKVLPAEKYSTNEFLPTGNVSGPSSAEKPGKTIHLKVGMPWILNDEESQLYNAIELGYFKDEGLDVELVSGGPGKDHLQTMAGGVVDIAIVAGGAVIPAARISPTPINATAVGTLLKDMPYTFIAIRPDLLDKKLTPEDFRGKTVGVQPASEFYLYMMLDRYNIPRDQVKIVEAGFTPDILLVGKADFYAGWIMNQPRLLEEKGFKWNALLYRDWVYSEPSDVITVRTTDLAKPEFQDVVRRFLRATYRGTQYLIAEPEKSAEIAAKYTTAYKDQPITKEQALSRFKKQETLILGTDKLGLMAMDADRWNQVVAYLTMYGQLQLECSK